MDTYKLQIVTSYEDWYRGVFMQIPSILPVCTKARVERTMTYILVESIMASLCCTQYIDSPTIYHLRQMNRYI